MVSAAEKPHSDDSIYRTMFDPSVSDPCTAVVEAVEEATGDGQADQPVLAESIDPDVLIRLYRNDSNSWMLSFNHEGIEITLWGDGRIHVDTTTVGEAARSGERTTESNTSS